MNTTKAIEALEIEIRALNEDRKYAGFIRPIDDRIEALHQALAELRSSPNLKHQLGVMTSTSDDDFNQLVDIVCDELLGSTADTAFMSNRMNEVVRRLHAQPSPWIKLSDRLPEMKPAEDNPKFMYSDEVILCHKLLDDDRDNEHYYTIRRLQMDPEGRVHAGSHTYWMPMPLPPTPEQQ